VKKHGVNFDEAAIVFGDPLAIIFDDPDHSDEEERFPTFCISASDKHVIVSHTLRVKIRACSARSMSPSERDIYEQG
jgi:uncharacterized DUF497 family protein